ncbi:MAG: ATP-dependent nuclease [Solirubrobacterales bacterium]
MKIQRLTVENFGNVIDLDIVVSGHAVIVGPNASGKSSVLRAIDACLSWSHAQLATGFPLKVLRNEDAELRVRMVLHDFSDDEVAALVDEIAIATDPADSTLTIQLTVARSASDPAEVDVSRVFLQPGVQPIPVTGRHLEAIGWSLIRASRNAERDLTASGAGALGQLLRRTDLGDDADAVDKALRGVDAALTSAQSVAQLRTDVASALSSVLASPITSDMVQVAIRTDQNPLRSVEVAVATSTGGDARSLLDQSDGLRSLAVMSLQLLGQAGDQITGVDEPETHLDTRSQARIGRLFSSPTGQRIIATHSPTVLRQFAPADVVAITDDGVRQFKSDVADRDRKFFSGWWVENMIEPLVSRSLILVEGPSDEILVRRVSELLSFDLDGLGVSLVNIGGANNFTNAFRLLGPPGFDLRMAALVDLKEEPIVSAVLGVDRSDLATRGVFTCSQDLEDVYVAALGTPRVAAMLASPAAGLGAVPEDAVLTRCRNNKVLAALGVANGLTAGEADQLTPIRALLERATDFT